ncbi:MAG: M56 family metallopeptidase [Phycisphaerae bacterium]|jgi:beta-lactamase regulating signal transducer with metallopeptidase domain/outer membrane lipoprotein-sorting protein
MNTILEQINSIGSVFVDFAVPMLVQSAVLIAVVFLADLLLRKKVRAVFRYWLWMLILLKLVLPTTLSSPVSFGSWFGDELANIKVSDTSVAAQPVNLPQVTETKTSTVTAAPTADINLIVSPAPLTWQGVVFLAWVAVASAMGLLLLQRSIFVVGLVAQAQNPTQLMNNTFSFCCGQMGIRSKVGLKISANTASPAVCGLFRPVVLVPQNLAPTLGSSRLRPILLHELAHIRRGDLWINLAQTILQIIYFYNPLLWLANSVIRRVREQAVDEAVQVAMGDSAHQYPQTLLDVAKIAFNRPVLSLRLIGVVESKSALKSRIKRMLDRPIPKTAKLGFLGLITLLLFAAVFLPMARAESGPPEFVIKGVVTDADTGQPIAGAKVGDDGYAEGKQCTTTDANGFYSYNTWYEEHNIKCEASGYKTQKGWFGTKLFGSEKEKVIDFSLESSNNSDEIDFNVPSEFTGHWKGRAMIIVNWCKQRWLSIDIEIKPDGTVAGQVGDSMLKNAIFKPNRSWLGKKLNIKTDWMIRGDLIGPIVKNEDIKREYINLLFDDLDSDGKIKGGFHTSGWHIGGKEKMVMSGTAMMLEKEIMIDDKDKTTPENPIVSVYPPSDSKMALFSELQVVFDQPMMPGEFNVVEVSVEEKFADWSDVAVIRSYVVYDADKYQFSMPLILPSNWNGSIRLSGFKTAKGVEVEPIVLNYTTLRDVLSDDLRQKLEKAKQSKEPRELLKNIKDVRSKLKSLSETVYTTYEYDNRKESKKVIFKMQGRNQFYVDMSGYFEKPWRIGSDGEKCWFYNEAANTKKLVAIDFNQIAEKTISICNPFQIAEADINTVMKQNNIEYLGTEMLDGRKCHKLRTWQVRMERKAICSIITGWFDSETYMPAKIVTDSGQWRASYDFIYDRINEPIDDSEFRPGFVTKIEPQEPEPLDEDYNKRYINIIDGSSNGRMSVRWGKRGPKGTSSSGLN